ncbi:MAG: glycosyltransferase [Actinomycetota bacterium]|nr:glycosyltransferase [Actinomycetota bacterium]
MRRHSRDHEDKQRPRVLAIAFSCGPGVGSEPGAAWGMVKSIAKVADVTVLVTSAEIGAIERHLQNEPDERLTFVAVSTPNTGIIHRLIGIHRQLWFFKYLSWLTRAKQQGLRLQAEHSFDAVVHVSYGSYWLPSPVVDIGPPSVWGPVGGATTTPWRLWPYLGWRGALGEIEGRVAIRLGTWHPATRRTWRKATIRIAETENTRRALPIDLRSETRVLNRAILSRVPSTEHSNRSSYVVFPSSLQGRKGPRLAVRALAFTPPSVRLRFISDGYEDAALQRLANRLGVGDRVEFLGRVSRDEMFRMMNEAAGVAFTGLREEGGCALSESMLVGAPVIVLGHGGPRLIAETNTDPSRVKIVAPSGRTATAREIGAAMTVFSTNPSQAKGSYLDRASVERALNETVLDAIEIGRR